MAGEPFDVERRISHIIKAPNIEPTLQNTLSSSGNICFAIKADALALSPINSFPSTFPFRGTRRQQFALYSVA